MLTFQNVYINRHSQKSGLISGTNSPKIDNRADLTIELMFEDLCHIDIYTVNLVARWFCKDFYLLRWFCKDFYLLRWYFKDFYLLRWFFKDFYLLRWFFKDFYLLQILKISSHVI